jgi:hypothetical protein
MLVNLKGVNEMKQPTIALGGMEFKVSAVHWKKDGSLAFIVIPQSDGSVKTIFHDEYDLEELLQQK